MFLLQFVRTATKVVIVCHDQNDAVIALLMQELSYFGISGCE